MKEYNWKLILLDGLWILNYYERVNLVVLLLWSVWKLRNNVVFKNKRFNINEVFFKVRSMVKEWKFKDVLILDNDKIKISYKRRKFYLVIGNFYRLIKGNKIILGCLIRGYYGKIVMAGVFNLEKVSVLIAEVTILRDRVKKVF